MTTSSRATEILARLELFGVRLGLEATRRMLRAIGLEERHPPQILIAGTNGKGSTAAMLSSILQASGRHVGLYTSPHLEEPRERIRIDGHSLPEETLGQLLERVVAVAESELGHPPTYFEALTVAAFAAFAERAVEVAVLEVGMGGRLDATNVADPILALVTRIGIDHVRHLGTTPQQIATEKAGIFRGGRPALVWGGNDEVERALRQVAESSGAAMEVVSSTVRWRLRGTATAEGRSVELETPLETYHVNLPLAGAYQVENLAMAVRGAEALAGLGWSGIDGESICRGVAACRWPGRLESVAVEAHRRVLLDAAHNPDGVRGLASFLAALDEPYALLFGALEEKGAEEALPLLAADATAVVLTRPESERALDPSTLAGALRHGGCVVDDPGEALDQVLRAPVPLIVVCGSIYLVGAVRRLLRRRFGVPPSAADSSSSALAAGHYSRAG